MERVKSNLKVYREKAGISQTELAELTGVTRKTISLLESPEGCNPRLSTAYRLVKYFDVALEQLFPEINE